MRENIKIDIDRLPIGYCEVKITKSTGKNFSYQILYANKQFHKITALNSSEVIDQNKDLEFCQELNQELFNQKKLKSYYNAAIHGSYMEFQQFCKILDKYIIVKVTSLARDQISICLETVSINNMEINDNQLSTDFLKVVDNSFDYLLILDKDLKVSYCNNNTKKLLGISDLSSLEGDAFQLVHPDDIANGQKAVSELLADPEAIFSNHIRIKSHDNSYRTMRFRMKNLLNQPGVNGFVINANDITQGKKAEKEIKETKNYLESLFNAIPNLIFVMDYQGNFLDVKGSDNDKLAYSQQQFLGKNISSLFPPYITEKLKLRLRLLKNNEPVDGFTYQRKNHLGDTRFYECILSVIDDQKVLALVNDVTTLKLAERTLENNQKDIQRKLDAIISPEGNLSNLELSDLVNIEELKDFFQTINDFTNIPITLLDKKGSVLFSLGSSNLCRSFHLAKTGALDWCKESHKKISNDMKIGESKLYKCKNNVWNFATPVYVGGERIATLDICQFRLADEFALSEVEIRRLANLHKFDKEKYIQAYYNLPVIDKERLIKVATYYRDLLSKITALSYAQIKQARTSHKLKLREEKLAQITDNMTDVIFINDFDFNVKYVSPSIQKLYGFTVEEYLKRSPSQRFPQETLEKISSILESELNKAPSKYNDILIEIQEYNANNELIDVSVHARLLLDSNNKPTAIIGSARDITHRIMIQNELNDQLELQSLLSSIAIKYINIPLEEIRESIQKSLEDFALYANADRAYIFKYDWEAGTCSNTYEWCSNGVNPEINNLQDVPVTFMSEWHKDLKLGKIHSIPEVMALSDDDDRKEFLLRQNIKSLISLPLMNKSECLGFIGFDWVKSIHNFSTKEYTVLQVFANLIVNVSNRIKMTQELRKEKERATESDKLKSNLLKNISHEFRTPLNGIIGLSELLKSTPIESEYKKMAKMIYTSGIRLDNVLDSIMLLSQLESISEKQHINLEKVDLEKLLQDLSKQFRNQVKQKGLDLIIDFHPQIYTYINQNLFKQAIIHIINNAIKYTHQGSISIFTSLSEDKQFVFLSIKDTGIGIPEDSQGLIFSDFRQVSEGYNRAYEGCGLGLPIAKKAIELMNGSISLESEFEKGAKFTIKLPLTLISQEEAATSLSKSPQKLKQKTLDNFENIEELPSVLIVEDNKINQKLAVSILRDKYRVDTCYDGESAINMIANKQYDIILMDIHLGDGLDGLETTKIIRNDIRYSKTPIIAVTGYTMLGDREHILKAGCSHYLSKPYSKSQLLDIIKLAFNTTEDRDF